MQASLCGWPATPSHRCVCVYTSAHTYACTHTHKHTRLLAHTHNNTTQVFDSADEWGPTAACVPPELENLPFAPFSKADKVGRASDWTQTAYQKFPGACGRLFCVSADSCSSTLLSRECVRVAHPCVHAPRQKKERERESAAISSRMHNKHAYDTNACMCTPARTPHQYRMHLHTAQTRVWVSSGVAHARN